MELHWGPGCRFYVTPVAANELCVVLVSQDPRLRIGDALPLFPALARRLPASSASTVERGWPAGSRLLRKVARGNVALIGDASATADAVTGEGICLAFRQAEALAGAFESERLSDYEAAHRGLMRRPVIMGELMLLLDRSPALRRRVVSAFAARPHLFRNLLAHHVGDVQVGRVIRTAAALGWGVIVQ